MGVGRDIYIDSRMILRRLEELFPPSEAHPALSSPETAGLAALLNKFTIDASVFTRAVQMMPPDRPSIKDESFLKDRAGFYGSGWTLHDALRRRPETIAHMRHLFDIVESLFADGRDWVAGTETVSFADLEGEICTCEDVEDWDSPDLQAFGRSIGSSRIWSRPQSTFPKPYTLKCTVGGTASRLRLTLHEREHLSPCRSLDQKP